MFPKFDFKSQSSMSHQRTGTTSEQKTIAKNAAHALMNHVKHGSPKLKKMIREKCRLRIKESRYQSFECSRKLQTDDKTMISNILREEIAEFEKDIELQDLIIKDMLEVAENWFIEELENELKSQEKYLVEINEKYDAFCPLCQKSYLKSVSGGLECICGISFRYEKSLQEFIKIMLIIVQNHETKCEQKPIFYIEPSAEVNLLGSLSCICIDCDYFYSLSN